MCECVLTVLTTLPALALASPQVVQPKVSPPVLSNLSNGFDAEQRTWLHLEEAASTLLNTAQQLKVLIEQAKQTSLAHATGTSAAAVTTNTSATCPDTFMSHEKSLSTKKDVSGRRIYPIIYTSHVIIYPHTSP